MKVCPHCHKLIKEGLNKPAIKRAEKLKREGHSLRSIEKILLSERLSGSGCLSSLSRHFKMKEES